MVTYVEVKMEMTRNSLTEPYGTLHMTALCADNKRYKVLFLQRLIKEERYIIKFKRSLGKLKFVIFSIRIQKKLLTFHSKQSRPGHQSPQEAPTGICQSGSP